MDCYQVLAEDDDAVLNAQLSGNQRCRIIISPSDGKLLLKQLETAIGEYEADAEESEAMSYNNSDDRLRLLPLSWGIRSTTSGYRGHSGALPPWW